MRVTIYNKDLAFLGQVGAPHQLLVTPRVYPLIGTAVFTIPLSSPQVANVTLKGARVVIEADDGEFLMSGPVNNTDLDTDTEELAVTVVDDSVILGSILGWPVPSQPITNQGGAEYRNYSGPAETVVKNVVRENGVTRLAIPNFTVAADKGRGSTIPGGTTYRMHPIPDRVYPGLDLAGIGLQVRQLNGKIVMDTYVPRVYPTVLSKEGRTLKRASHTRTRPLASRVVIGGPGEGKARRFRFRTDAAREAEWGFLGETYRDARDVQQEEGVTSWTAVDATLDARGDEALSEARAVDGLSVTLAESSIFIYGEKGIRVGDIAQVRVLGNIITDTVKEATLEQVTPKYTRATPVIGEQSDPATKQAKTLSALREAQRKEERA